MASKIQLLRSSTFGARPANGSQPYGVPYVNFADRQIGVVDAGTIPVDFIGVPFFSASANYNIGQPVNYQGKIYRAIANVTAGAFNAGQWSEFACLVDLSSYVSYASQAPTAAQQLQARKNIYAAPFDAMMYNNLAINGAMESYSSAPSTTLPDLWLASALNPTATVAYSMVGLGGAGWKAASYALCSAGSGTTNAATLQGIAHVIEGNRAARLAWGTASALPLTISFLLALPRAGTFCVTLRNGALNRSYVATVAGLSGWNFYQITIPGDTSGTWANDNTAGIKIFFCFQAGTNYHTATPNVWTATGALSTTAQSNNCFTTTNDSVALTCVHAVPGSQGPSSQTPLITAMRTLDEEIRLVQRQWRKSYVASVNYGTVTNAGQFVGSAPVSAATTVESFSIAFGRPMRATPSVAIFNAGTGAQGSLQLWCPAGGGIQSATAAVNNICENGFQVGATGATGLSVGAVAEMWGHYYADARLN